MIKYFVAILCCASLMAGSLKQSATMSRISLKHREHNGVGYETGYSSGDLFLAPIWRHVFLPFMNLRFHVMNDGRFAFNGGLGLRTPLTDEWIFGLNAYYDYRSAEDFSPNQIGVGFEALGKPFDVRLNGYAPFGNDEFFRRHPVVINGQTASFKEEALAALPVVSGEVGVPFFERCSNFFLYSALGPYYLFQRQEHGFTFGGSWGGKARLSATISKILQIECDVTYDKIFHTTVQGMVALRIPLGPRNLGYKDTTDVLCSRITQPVVRNEIIPIQDPDRIVPLLHPETGKPAHFVFVNSTEGDIRSLAQAEKKSKPGDVIYVHYADGKIYPGTLKLKPRQMLHSSALPFISGQNGFMASTPGKSPKLEGVVLADQTKVMGFEIKTATIQGRNALLALSQVGELNVNAIERVELLQNSIERTAKINIDKDLAFVMQSTHLKNGITLTSHKNAQVSVQMAECQIEGPTHFECLENASLSLALSQNRLKNLTCKLNTTAQKLELASYGNHLSGASIETNTQLVYDWKNNTIEPTIVTIGEGKAINVASGSQPTN